MAGQDRAGSALNLKQVSYHQNDRFFMQYVEEEYIIIKVVE